MIPSHACLCETFVYLKIAVGKVRCVYIVVLRPYVIGVVKDWGIR